MQFCIIRYNNIFNNNDKKTGKFIYQIEETHGFSFQNGLKNEYSVII